MSKKVVLAIGGNSLIKDEEHETVQDQYAECVETCKHIVKLLKMGNKIVITHGNGPQVGFILRRCELARDDLHMVPIDSCVADTQGAIGYNIQMALRNEMLKNDLPPNVVTVVTQVVVDANDPSLKKPTKPIGYFMTEKTAKLRQEEEGWDIVQDAGRGFRRVVPSPIPIEIIELRAINALLEKNMAVVAGGGGGIPVVDEKEGFLKGVEAVIDKDLTACLLAKKLKANLFVISTAVERVCVNYGQPNEKALDIITLKQAKKLIKEGHFAEGSMLPKVKAMVDYIETTGNTGIITDPEHLEIALKGKAGTKFIP